MLALASPWQSAQDFSTPALLDHSASPSSTESIPGFELSSACMARLSGPMNSVPDLRWSSGISAAGSGDASAANRRNAIAADAV